MAIETRNKKLARNHVEERSVAHINLTSCQNGSLAPSLTSSAKHSQVSGYLLLDKYEGNLILKVHQVIGMGIFYSSITQSTFGADQ